MALAHKFNSQVLILTIIVLLLGALATWLWIWPALTNDTIKQPTTGQEAPTGNNTPDQPDNHATTVYEYTSAKGEIIKITGIAKNDTITSPLTITGEVRGSWSFEASFPIDLNYGGEDLITIASTSATLNGDWMTNDYMPFTATLSFTPPADAASGILIIHNANPSGLPENDDSVGISVNF